MPSTSCFVTLTSLSVDYWEVLKRLLGQPTGSHDDQCSRRRKDKAPRPRHGGPTTLSQASFFDLELLSRDPGQYCAELAPGPLPGTSSSALESWSTSEQHTRSCEMAFEVKLFPTEYLQNVAMAKGLSSGS